MAVADFAQATVPLDNNGVSAEAELTSPAYNATQIPALVVDDQTKLEIELWLQEEINFAKSERSDMEEQWKLIQKLYEMIELEDKDYPFEDSSHLVIQLIATFTETVWAKIVNTIFSPSDPFAAKPLRKDLVAAAKSLRKFMTWASKEELMLEEKSSLMFMEMVKLGMCVAKVIYAQDDRTRFIYDPTTRQFSRTSIRIKDHPDIIHVPLADFFYRQHHKSLDECVWLGHRIVLTWGEILRRKASGALDSDAVDKFLIRYNAKNGKKDVPQQDGHITNRTPYEAERDQVIGVAPRANDTFEFYEVWFEYLVPGQDALPIELVGMFEPDSGTLFKLEHNWYPLQMRPFVDGQYIPREHRIPGIGVGIMTLAFQNEITAMHNQRIDNATIANASAIFMQEDSTMPLNLKVKPGGTYGVPNPKDVNVVQLGQKYDSTIEAEKHALLMVQQRIGMQDFVEHTSAQTSTQAILNMQEATRKFDMVVRNARSFETRIIERCLLLYQQYYPDGKPMMVLGEEEGMYVEELFKLAQNDIKYGISIQVTATSSSTAKEIERQTKLSLFNMMTQYYGQLTQYVLQSQNPQMPPMVQQTMLLIVEALGALVGDILEDFNEPNVDRLVIDSKDGIGIGAPPPQPTAPPGAAGPSQGNAPQPGMGPV